MLLSCPHFSSRGPQGIGWCPPSLERTIWFTYFTDSLLETLSQAHPKIMFSQISSHLWLRWTHKMNHHIAQTWKCEAVSKKNPLSLPLDFPGVSAVKTLPAMQEMQVWSLGQEDPLERKWLSPAVFLPGKSHEQRSLWGKVYGAAKSWTQVGGFVVQLLSHVWLFRPHGL